MRLKLTLISLNNEFSRPNKHAVQGFIYHMLKGTEYGGERHDQPKFKFFTFSDFFLDREGRPTFIVSSPPERGFINALHSTIKERESIHIGKNEYQVAELRKFRLPLRKAFQTGSPVVIYRNASKNEYFKLHAHRDLRFFLDRLKENAEKKYNAFYGEELSLEGPLFDRMIPKVRQNGR